MVQGPANGLALMHRSGDIPETGIRHSVASR